MPFHRLALKCVEKELAQTVRKKSKCCASIESLKVMKLGSELGCSVPKRYSNR